MPRCTARMLAGNTRGIASAGHNSVKYASLPYDPFTPYLLAAYPIRVQSRVPVNGPEVPIKATEATYGLMMHMSGSLGVNCSYCHNTRAFSDWSQSRPQRVTAWYGIRMVRNINNDYIQKLAYAMPANRKGPLGDPYKVNCTTCHQGLPLPLYGVSMRKEHPQLWGPVCARCGRHRHPRRARDGGAPAERRHPACRHRNAGRTGRVGDAVGQAQAGGSRGGHRSVRLRRQ